MSKEARLDLAVKPEEAGTRLDAFLAIRLPDMSRSRLARLVRSGKVLVNGAASKPSAPVVPGQDVVVRIPEAEPADLVPENIPLDVLYEDPDLIVVNKPPGMVAHPGPGHGAGTLVHALLAHCPDLSGVGGVARPGIVHRLDKDTSGALVAAKNDAAHQSLSRQFKARTIKKTYLALVHGCPAEDTGRISLPVGRHPSDRKKMLASEDVRGREAQTLWRVRERYPDAALLEIGLLTGRTHQIRVHMAALGHHVVGDPIYGGRKRGHKLPDSVRGKVPLPGRQLLHAWRLVFAHPRTGRLLDLEAPIPVDMRAVISAFSAHTP